MYLSVANSFNPLQPRSIGNWEKENSDFKPGQMEPA